MRLQVCDYARACVCVRAREDEYASVSVYVCVCVRVCARAIGGTSGRCAACPSPGPSCTLVPPISSSSESLLPKSVEVLSRSVLWDRWLNTVVPVMMASAFGILAFLDVSDSHPRKDLRVKERFWKNHVSELQFFKT